MAARNLFDWVDYDSLGDTTKLGRFVSDETKQGKLNRKRAYDHGIEFLHRVGSKVRDLLHPYNSRNPDWFTFYQSEKPFLEMLDFAANAYKPNDVLQAATAIALYFTRYEPFTHSGVRNWNGSTSLQSHKGTYFNFFRDLMDLADGYYDDLGLGDFETTR